MVAKKAQLKLIFSSVQISIYDGEFNENRNKLLQECDWIELNNAPLTSSKKTEWQTYRTKLRDITNGLDTVDKVKAVTWPTKP